MLSETLGILAEERTYGVMKIEAEEDELWSVTRKPEVTSWRR